MYKGMNKGFTLMELMIVIAIIMILAGAIVARVSTGGEKAKIAKATSEMNEIASACRSFYSDTGYWPYANSFNADSDGGLIDKSHITHVIADSGTATSAGSVITTVKNLWKGPYIEAFEWPMDPWKTYHYDLYYHYSSGTYKALYVLSYGPNASGDSWDWTTGKPGGDNIMVLVHRF